MADLEAAVGQSLVPLEHIGTPLRVLQAFWALLFLDTAAISDSPLAQVRHVRSLYEPAVYCTSIKLLFFLENDGPQAATLQHLDCKLLLSPAYACLHCCRPCHQVLFCTICTAGLPRLCSHHTPGADSLQLSTPCGWISTPVNMCLDSYAAPLLPVKQRQSMNLGLMRSFQ